MKKRTGKLVSLLLVLVMLLGMVPVMGTTAMAAGGVRADSKYGENGKILFTVNESGVLTWSAVPGATSYDLTLWMTGGLFKSETGLTSTSYPLEAVLDQYKKDSGTVKVSLAPKGVYDYGDSASFLYSSPYPKLEAPVNLRWDANGNQISKELLCKSEYKVKNEIIQYGI